MASFGIGLGAFVDAIPTGMGIRRDADEGRRQRKEQQRADENRTRFEAIDQRAQGDFQTGVERGDFQPDEFLKFYMDEVVPAKRDELLRQGDVDGARAWDEWARSDAAQEGARLFASAMFKAQTGDHAGALQDVLKAGELNGYIEHGYEFSGQDELVDEQGNLIGFRLTMKDPGGREVVQDIAVGDLPDMIVQLANPEAAYQSQQAGRAARSEADLEVQTHLRKREGEAAIDSAYGTGDQAELRQTAIDNLRKRMEPDILATDPSPSFDDLSRDEQDRLIQQEIDLLTGERSQQGAPQAPQVIVDRTTGEPVGLPGGPAQAPAPERSDVGQVPTGTGLTQTANAPSPPPRPAQPADRQAFITNAANLLQQGADPQQIAAQLQAAGIAPNEWPAQLLQHPQLGMPAPPATIPDQIAAQMQAAGAGRSNRPAQLFELP